MKVLGIDPGSSESAWVVYSSSPPKVHEHDYCPNEALLRMLRCLDRGSYDGVAVEWIQSQGRKRVGNSTFNTAAWAGRFLEAAHPVPACPVNRRRVIGHFCGSFGGDQQIREALMARELDTDGITGHVWQALACAICFTEAIAK